MATVTGMTADKVVEITDASVTSAAIDETTGVLTLQTRGGQTITAGNVRTEDTILNAIDRSYPVGSIFMSAIATSPADQLGIGTWESWGSGRMAVGVDPAQTEFAVTEQTGGAKTHTLSTTEMPKHSHTGPDHTHPMNHGHGTGTTDTKGVHDHQIRTNDVSGYDNGVMGTGSATGVTNNSTPILDDGGHTHQMTIPTFNGSTSGGGTGSTGSAGGNPDATTQPHNNLPPYITCHMWKRVA